jgi:ribosome modulation factor
MPVITSEPEKQESRERATKYAHGSIHNGESPMSQTITPSSSSNQEPSSSRKKRNAKDERIDSALRAALYMHEDSQSRWEKLIADGAHDNQIWHGLISEFGTGGGSQTDDGILFAYLAGANAVEPPKFWIDTSNFRAHEKPTLKGAALVKRVRELLQIPAMRSERPHEFRTAENANGCLIGCGKSFDDPIHNVSADALDDTAESGEASDKRVLDLAFLADLEDEQKGCWEVICKYDRLLADAATPKRDHKRLKGERRDVQGRYEDVWDDAVKALDGDADIVQDVRDRVEASPSTIATSGEGVPETHEDSSYADETAPAALLAKTEEEQRARFAALTLLDETLTTDPPARRRKKLEKERNELRAVYDGTYAEAASAFGVEAAEQMRARIEYPAEILINMLALIEVQVDAATVESWTLEQRVQAQEFAAAVHLSASDNDDVVVPPRPDFLPLAGITSEDVGNGDCGPDCQHTGEEHAAFDAGVQAGKRGDDQDACPFDSDHERDAWLSGYSIGEANALTGKTPATTDAAPTPATFTRQIEVELTDADYKRISRESAFKGLQIEELEGEMKRTVDVYKKKIGGLEQERNAMDRILRNGHDTLELEVFERRDFGRKVVELVRADNSQVVESRQMTERETQQHLFAPSI